MSVIAKGQGSLLVRGQDGETLPLMFRRRETHVIEAGPDASTRLADALGSHVGVITLVTTGALFFNHGGATVEAADPLDDGESGYLGAGGSIDLPLRPHERYLAARAFEADCRLYIMVRG